METLNEYTQRISPLEALQEYCRNEEFRNCLECDSIVYVEDVFVFNTPKIVRNEDGKLFLEDGIREHLEDCALSFSVELIFASDNLFGNKDKFSGGKIKKQKKFNLEITKKNLASSDKLSSEIKQEWLAQVEMFEYQVQHEQSCWKMIGRKLDEKRAYPEEFEQKTLLPQRYYYRSKNDKKESPPSIRTVMAIAAGYDFDLPFVEELLKLAGHALSTAIPEHMAYRFILRVMKGRDIQEKNALLRSSGFDPLGVATDDDDDKDEE